MLALLVRCVIWNWPQLKFAPIHFVRLVNKWLVLRAGYYYACVPSSTAIRIECRAKWTMHEVFSHRLYPYWDRATAIFEINFHSNKYFNITSFNMEHVEAVQVLFTLLIGLVAILGYVAQIVEHQPASFHRWTRVELYAC